MKKTTGKKSAKEARTTYRVSRRVSKPAITIPAPVRDAAEQLAQHLNISLSELYTSALTIYIAEHQTTAGAGRRQAGSARGLLSITDDFDAPLADFAEYQ